MLDEDFNNPVECRESGVARALNQQSTDIAGLDQIAGVFIERLGPVLRVHCDEKPVSHSGEPARNQCEIAASVESNTRHVKEIALRLERVLERLDI